MQLVINTYGASIGKHSERLVIRDKNGNRHEIPLDELEQLTIASHGIGFSSDVIEACCERGIQISFITPTGRPFAQLVAPNLTGTVITRREQLLAYHDKRGVILAKALVRAKLKNQAHLLRYFAKYRKATDPEAFTRLSEASRAIEELAAEAARAEGASVDEIRPALLGLEGRAARHYWDAFGLLVGERASFPGREHRGATDPVNSLLNYGYGILYTQVWAAVLLAGLEPFAGFLHVDRPGKPSLVLDLVEEFRQAVVDRTVLAMVGKGVEVAMEEDRLADATRKELATRVLERLEETERYRGRKLRLRSIIQCQAREMASFLRGESDFRPFVGGW